LKIYIWLEIYWTFVNHVKPSDVSGIGSALLTSHAIPGEEITVLISVSRILEITDSKREYVRLILWYNDPSLPE